MLSATERLQDEVIQDVDALVESMGRVRDHIATLIFGQTRVVDQVLITLLSGGHVLLVGVPGLAKTRLTARNNSWFVRAAGSVHPRFDAS